MMWVFENYFSSRSNIIFLGIERSFCVIISDIFSLNFSNFKLNQEPQ